MKCTVQNGKSQENYMQLTGLDLVYLYVCVSRLQPLCIKSLTGEEVIKVAAGSHHSLALTAQCQVRFKLTHRNVLLCFHFQSKLGPHKHISTHSITFLVCCRCTRGAATCADSLVTSTVLSLFLSGQRYNNQRSCLFFNLFVNIHRFICSNAYF